LGLGRVTAIASGENPTNLSAYAGAITQAGIAGYGAYGWSCGGDIWSEAALGAARASTVIQEINQVESNDSLSATTGVGAKLESGLPRK